MHCCEKRKGRLVKTQSGPPGEAVRLHVSGSPSDIRSWILVSLLHREGLEMDCVSSASEQSHGLKYRNVAFKGLTCRVMRRETQANDQPSPRYLPQRTIAPVAVQSRFSPRFSAKPTSVSICIHLASMPIRRDAETFRVPSLKF